MYAMLIIRRWYTFWFFLSKNDVYSLYGEGDRYCWPLIRRTLIDKRTKRRINALDSSIAVNDDIAVFQQPDSVFAREARTSFLKFCFFLVTVIAKYHYCGSYTNEQPVNYYLRVPLNHIQNPERALTKIRNLTIAVETFPMIFPPANVS